MGMQKNNGLAGEKNPNYRHGARVRDAQGKNTTPEYNSWYGMVQRCTNPKRRYYHRYGGRGIKVHASWREFSVFLRDMGPRPAGTSLDRVDNNGDYTPDNCRWATDSEQRRNSTRARNITVYGETKGACDWAAIVQLPPTVICRRLRRGWSAEEAVFTPLRAVTDKRYKRNKDHSVK